MASAYELERLARIRANEARLAALLDGISTELLAKPTKQPRSKQRPHAVKARRPLEASRRSTRIQQLPAPEYVLVEPRGFGRSTSGDAGDRSWRGARGARHHGLARTLRAADDDAWYWNPAGWKPAFGAASPAAAAAALKAAWGLVERLEGEGRHAFVKEMSESQVSGGFWCQLPSGITEFYGPDKLPELQLVCDDKAAQDPDTFWYNVDGSATNWPVVYLPRPSGSGLSGGWRGFAIDQHLHPNDTVVFEVMYNSELDGGTAGAGAGATESTAEAAPGTDGGARKKYMRAHLFRAFSYEADAGAAQKQQQLWRQPSDESAAAANDAEGDELLDVPLAKRRKTAATAPQAAAQTAAAEVCADAMRVGSMAADTSQAGRDQGSKAKRGPAASQRTQQQRPRKDGAAAAPPPPAAAAVAQDATRPSRKRRLTECAEAAVGAFWRFLGSSAKPEDDDDAAEEAAPPAEAGSGGRAGSSSGGAAPSKASKQGGRGGKGGGAVQKKLVPQPVDASVLVAPPTAEEVEKDAAGGPFWVRHIMAHKVDPESGADLFLIRWWGFGAWWDSWEGADCLDAAPATYTWHGGRAAIPAKFLVRL